MNLGHPRVRRTVQGDPFLYDDAVVWVDDAVVVRAPPFPVRPAQEEVDAQHGAYLDNCSQRYLQGVRKKPRAIRQDEIVQGDIMKFISRKWSRFPPPSLRYKVNNQTGRFIPQFVSFKYNPKITIAVKPEDENDLSDLIFWRGISKKYTIVNGFFQL